VDAVNSALDQLGLDGASRPTLFTVLGRAGDMKLVQLLSL
jgi:hypothetical protein